MFNDTVDLRQPSTYSQIEDETRSLNFSMASDLQTGSFLRTLAATKAKAKLLELGTGTGLSTAWILEGMDAESTLVSIDNEADFQRVAEKHLGHDSRLSLICGDGKKYVKTFERDQHKFDFIFADAWPGKYDVLQETLSLLNKGGIYVIDDMLPQPNWPNEHQENADQLVAYLESRNDLTVTKFNWSTGILLAVKK
ncbi:MAG: class I SAM-dependent methyltransferase [Bacteroidota bacterium]